jgi:FixJ family two-component response regulator
MDGPILQNRLKSDRLDVPIIFITGTSNLGMAVQAMRDGAADFLQKPVGVTALLASVALALQGNRQTTQSRVLDEGVAARLATLTRRERQVMDLMITGTPSKIIAADLKISQRTTEHHRQSVMRKMAAKSLAALVRMVALHVPHG